MFYSSCLFVLKKHNFYLCVSVFICSYMHVFMLYFTDTTPPTLTCPLSRTVQLRTGNDQRSFNFTDPVQGFTPSVSDTGGVASVRFSQDTVIITAINLYSRLGPFTVIASDLQGNQASCNFYISVEGMK